MPKKSFAKPGLLTTLKNKRQKILTITKNVQAILIEKEHLLKLDEKE